jgi:WD40 repeat protein
VAFSADAKRLLTESDDKTAKVWDAETGQELMMLKGHAGAVNSVAFSTDGKRLLTGSDDKTAKVWDAAPPFPP